MGWQPLGDRQRRRCQFTLALRGVPTAKLLDARRIEAEVHMKRLVSRSAAWVTLLMCLGSRQTRADASISAEEFAAQCADAGGNLTLDQDVRIEGGSAELAECQVTVGSFRLDIERARLLSTGFLRVFGESGGEIRVAQSALAQSDQAAGPVNILLRAHRVLIEATTIDFSGTVHLETGRDDRGEVHVVNSRLRSIASDIHVGSSGRGHEGGPELRSRGWWPRWISLFWRARWKRGGVEKSPSRTAPSTPRAQ